MQHSPTSNALTMKSVLRTYGESLVRPDRVYRRHFSASDASVLALSFFLVSLLLAVLTIPFLIDTLRDYFRQHSEIAPSARVASIGMAVGIGASLNLILVASVTMLLALGLAIMGRKIDFANSFSLVLLSSTPIILDRMVALVRGWTGAPEQALEAAFPLSAVFHASGVTGEALAYFGVFDLWRSLLVFLAMLRAANGRVVEAVGYFLAIWVLLLAALFQIHHLKLFG